MLRLPRLFNVLRTLVLVLRRVPFMLPLPPGEALPVTGIDRKPTSCSHPPHSATSTLTQAVSLRMCPARAHGFKFTLLVRVVRDSNLHSAAEVSCGSHQRLAVSPATLALPLPG